MSVNNLTSVEIKNEKFFIYTGHFELISDNFLGEPKQSITMRFKHNEAYQIFFKNNDMDYNVDETRFNGCTYKKNNQFY